MAKMLIRVDAELTDELMTAFPVIQSVIQPKFVGDRVGLSTSLTFLSLVVWAWALGSLGGLLAIPLSLLARQPGR